MSVSLDDTVTAFAEAVGTEGPVAAVGERTRWDVGGSLDEGTRLVRAPAGVVEHQPEEMTVRVRAGTRVAELHEALALAGQRSALCERDGTVGGAVAVGEGHLCALGRGSLRDAVLQVRYVSADGRVVTGGGPTVKNVSGYDLPRLHVGSLGTLGLLAEVVLRTQPVPPASRWLAAAGVDPFAVRDALYKPGAILWDGATCWVQLEGHVADVRAEAGVLAKFGAWQDAPGPPALPPHRWSVAPAALRAWEVAGPWVAAIGVGVVHASAPAPVRPPAVSLGELARRVKDAFDPAGRLAPGRRPGR